ncbi:tungstate transport system substrate-binding protein [Jannaschia faecimaris]|uniref:Tungstate transport system substrate-binding protein n=1 Tax=Jannaschia faecimaris TaxID=1244108 RepID=A0A1H3JP35_9RHOB|nr:substrate-binding domain-containing protein [Jannaschia faecimaris]SDY41034.1 tungstate transport system substrate-binding protein [Jannaschia faecimaris]
MLLRALLFCLLPVAAPAETMKMAVTTSFQNSGLADVLLPEIRDGTDIEVQLVVVGTGQALRLGAAGDVDAVLVHSRPAEDAFVAAGNAEYRREIMYNDFVIVGPVEDPAGINGAQSAPEALARIAAAEVPFVSRGDDSGTHKAELALWEASGLPPEGDWYRPVGAGMGAALNTAVGMGAYVLSDRASWLNFGNKDGMAIAFQGDPALFNQYAYLPVNPDKHAHVNAEAAARLEDWLVSERAETLINGYRVAGEQLFTFNAER